MATIKENFKFIRGDSYTRLFSISKMGFDISPVINKPEPCPITEIYYTVKENQDGKALVMKTLGNGIEMLSEDDEKYHYMLVLNCNCTDKLKSQTKYIHDIQVLIGDVKQTLMTGELYLEKEVTTTHCERRAE